jgi:hypothetical protein
MTDLQDAMVEGGGKSCPHLATPAPHEHFYQCLVLFCSWLLGKNIYIQNRRTQNVISTTKILYLVQFECLSLDINSPRLTEPAQSSYYVLP